MNLATLAVLASLAAAPPSTGLPDPPMPTPEERAKADEAMVGAAKEFLASLDAAQKATASRSFEAAERTTWSYLRGPRPGLFLRDLSEPQRSKAMALATAGLSEEGRRKVARIRTIEALNQSDERAQGAKEPTYGDELYAVIVFGEPGVKPWGFRFEGHHIGLHFSSLSGETTCTPLFFGSYPAAIREGSEKGTRPLGATQDLALALHRSLSPEQAARAKVGDSPPADIITSPGHERALHGPAAAGGISMADLGPSQREELWGLVLRHALDLRGDLASDEIKRMKAAGVESIRFGFAGEPSLDKPHYYRIVGPTFAIEFDCTQGTPNHVHCVWNDPERNFGGDPLRDHLLHDHAR